MPPPLTRNSAHDGPWDCCLCRESFMTPPTTSRPDVATLAELLSGSVQRKWTYRGDGRWARIMESETDVCEICIRRPFKQALDFECEMPARWGKDILQPINFRSILSDEFIQQYTIKLQEHNNRSTNLDLTPETLKGLERGKDYQFCPKCGAAISLKEGCNHVICLCDTNLCFICGKEASGNSRHWTPDGCPRFTNNESGAVIFDDPVYDEPNNHEDPVEIVAGLPHAADHGLPNHPMRQQLLAERNSLESIARFDIHTWTFNVAMHASDVRTRNALQSTLLLNSGPAELQTFHYRSQRRSLSAQLAFNHLHGVSEEWWDMLAAEWRQRLTSSDSERPHRPSGLHNAQLNTETQPGGGEYLRPLLRNRPVSSVFNMVLHHTRMRAFQWIVDRVNLCTPDNHNEADNFAIFDLGPGGTFSQRRAAAYLMQTLNKAEIPSGQKYPSLLLMMEHYILFEPMAGNAVLVRVQGTQVPIVNVSANDPARRLCSFSDAVDLRVYVPDIQDHNLDSLRPMFEDPQSLLGWRETVLGPFDAGRHTPWIQFIDHLAEDGSESPQHWEVSELTGAEWRPEHEL